MLLRLRFPTLQRGWFFTVIALLALTAQIAVAIAPLGEDRERSMAAHVESGGATGHFTHNDATCPACQARSIAGSTSVAVPPPIVRAHTISVAIARVPRTHSAGVSLHQNSRAPPVVS